jgi:hypothetical protein
MLFSSDDKTTTMTLVRSTLLALLGAGLLPAGCAGDLGDAGGSEGTGVARGAFIADPIGGSSTNGLGPDPYRVHIGRTRAALSTRIVTPGLSLNPAVAALFDEAIVPLAESSLPYLLKCGLPEGITLTLNTPEGTQSHQGLLTTTGAWATGGIFDFEAKRDMFACLAIHLNAKSAHVDVRLTGAAVRNQPEGGDESKFTFEEAYWWVQDPATVGLPKIHVWPLPDLTGACGAKNTSAALKKRVCGNDPLACQFTLRTDLGACVRTPNGAFCDGHRVIMSWLRTDDVPLMYDRCTLPPEGGGSSGTGGTGPAPDGPQ